MYTSITSSSCLLHEPNNIYYRNRPVKNRYIPGNSRNTYRIITETLGKQKEEGCWVLLFGNDETLKHHEKLGKTKMGFGDIRSLLQIALKHECLSLVLVSHSHENYIANRTDLIYNLNVITSAVNISMCLLDHIVTFPDGYYSFRDNGLLTYMEN